jgi:hypothetical protein
MQDIVVVSQTAVYNTGYKYANWLHKSF